MGLQATLYAMDAFRLLMYTPMGWSPAGFIASTAKGYYPSPPAPLFAASPMICHSAWWWNLSSTLSISPITTHILLP